MQEKLLAMDLINNVFWIFTSKLTQWMQNVQLGLYQTKKFENNEPEKAAYGLEENVCELYSW